MNFLGLTLEVKNLPELDSSFVPMSAFFSAHQAKASVPLAVAVQRGKEHVSVYETKIIGTKEHEAADEYYLDRLVKFLLWSRGGYKVSLCGNGGNAAKTVQKSYTDGGSRAFDKGFMERVYERPFELVLTDYDSRPAPLELSQPIGRHMDGCRIGFDAGGSDRKVSAVIDGVAVYSEEVIWHPKQNTDPDYHYAEIVDALKTAASKMPRVDAIGVSSAGVYVDNRCMVASLFIKVSDEDFALKAKDIYLRAAGELGDIPLVVANDGDVSALAGSMALDSGALMGIAMGTSEAVGYVDEQGNVTGWLNELAFAPVDGQPDAMLDEWSGDIGCGVKYFSQDAVIKLAAPAGITLQGNTPAEKLKEVQRLMQQDDERAAAIFRSIGIYLGHALAHYSLFYNIKHVQMLGRVSSGKGGDIILEKAAHVLKEEYPHITFEPKAPDEKTRRVGQSVAAASLPKV